MKAKMTPGPWKLYDQALDDGPEYGCVIESETDKDSDWIAQEIHNRVDARAIACLPELLNAARNVLELDKDTFPNYVRQTFAELRRILARIEGEEA